MAPTAAVVLLAAGTATAQPSPADKETARARMQEGRDFRDKGDLKGALQRFKAADDIMHVPTTALEVARTQVALGLLVEACDTVGNIHKAPARADDPAPFKDARVKADELDAQIEGRVPSLTIHVTGAAEGDAPAVTVDGVVVPAAALGVPRKVNPGHHTVAANAASGTASEEVDLADGEKKDLQLALVAGDGAPDEHDSKPSNVHTPNALTWGGLIVGGVGLVAGSITGLVALSKKSTLESECNRNKQCAPGQPQSDLSSANSMATISTVSFLVAGAGAGVAVVSLLVGHAPSSASTPPAAPPGGDPDSPPADPAAAPPAPESRLHVTPWIGLGSAGVSGTF